MKKLLGISLVALFAISSSAYAVTGDGHARITLLEVLAVTNTADVNFGEIAVDPAAGLQTITIDTSDTVSCPGTYVCSGAPASGSLAVQGAPSGTVDISVSGTTATLDDGGGNTLTFDPYFVGSVESLASVSLDGAGQATIPVGGTLDIPALTPVAGTYTSQNGSAYTVTVNY
ncbi:MAG: DUF4402 domain-containing protein [Alphaproteobacteria bacterium]